MSNCPSANIGTELYDHIATAHAPQQGSIECVLCDSTVFSKVTSSNRESFTYFLNENPRFLNDQINNILIIEKLENTNFVCYFQIKQAKV